METKMIFSAPDGYTVGLLPVPRMARFMVPGAGALPAGGSSEKRICHEHEIEQSEAARVVGGTGLGFVRRD